MDKPGLPDYAGACITNIVPALLDGTIEAPSWIPSAALEADQVVLLVLDGLGWDQLQARRHLAPTLAALAGGPITSVSPTTTATALTSIATGLTPGEHGVVGYRVAVDHEVLNILRWTTPAGDARQRIEPGNRVAREALGLAGADESRVGCHSPCPRGDGVLKFVGFILLHKSQHFTY